MAKLKMPSFPAPRVTKAAEGQLRKKKKKQIDPEATEGGWRQNDWKVKRSKQGTPSRSKRSDVI